MRSGGGFEGKEQLGRLRQVWRRYCERERSLVPIEPEVPRLWKVEADDVIGRDLRLKVLALSAEAREANSAPQTTHLQIGRVARRIFAVSDDVAAVRSNGLEP